MGARRMTLDNGLALVARPNRSTATVALHLSLRAGAAFDPAGRPGVAHLVARLLDRGARGLAAARIAEDFDARGIGFAARARVDSLDLTLRLLSRDLPFALQRLWELSSAPEFPPDELARERDRVLTEIAERDQDTAAQAEDRMSEMLFPAGHPYHAPLTGTRDSVAAIGRDDLARHHADRCGASGAVLVLSGDLDPARTLDAAAQRFSGFPVSRAAPAPIGDAPPPAPRVEFRAIAGKTQADIALAYVPAVRRRGDDLQAALLMSSVLGEFGMGGRLGRAVREEAGLAYYAHSYVWAGLGAGPVVIRAGVAPERVRPALAIIRRTVDRFLRRGATPREIDDSKRALIGSIPRRFETNAGAAALLADSELQGVGYDHAERVPALVAAVTRDQVDEAARRYVTPDRSVLVVSGPDGGGAGLA